MDPDKIPSKPASRPDKVSMWRHIQMFREDIFSSQPAKLYRAWMAEFRTPFFRSYMINQPDLIKLVLKERPDDFPKSKVVQESLETLLGNSVFVTNGEVWKRQRRIIDPAFEGGRLKETFPAMLACGEDVVARMQTQVGKGAEIEVEAHTAHAAADVIFRTLFSIPISDDVATEVFAQFRDYQRTQPLLNLASFLPLPKWMPRFRNKETTKTSGAIRDLIRQITAQRAKEIAAGSAPDDLATKIMTTADPETGEKFDTEEMIDQVAIFFLAGHETSASALAWSLYLLAFDPAVQERLHAEVMEVIGDESPTFAMVNKLKFAKAVFRETMRLYPPVPGMIRSNLKPEHFRDRDVRPGCQVLLSPWHLHRHERLWERPHHFDPDRWTTDNGKQCMREAYIPFSAGPRVCTGSGFAMIEGPLLLAMLVRAFRFELIEGREPVPVAHLTLRAKDGIWLRLVPREARR